MLLLAAVLAAVALPARAGADDRIVTVDHSVSTGLDWYLSIQTLDGVVTGTLPLPDQPAGYQMLPDGSVVFGTASGNGIWLEHPGEEPVQLTDGPYDTDPSATPDGSRVVFSRWAQATNTYDLYVVNGDGSGLTKVTDGQGLADYHEARFSSDGTAIAYTCQATPAAYEAGRALACGPQLDGAYWYTGVLLMNPDGTDKRMIQRAQTFDLGWSPDGQWLAEVANISVDLGGGVFTGYDELYVFKTDGSDLFADEAKVRYVKLSDDPSALVPIAPTFNQDGNRIAFLGVVPAENAEFVYVVNRDGSELARLALEGGNPEFLPAAGGGGPQPTVDATHIVVPHTEGRTLASALKTLTARHFKVRVVKRYSKLRRGRVLGTKPRAGKEAHRPDEAGARLTIYVSKGRKPHRHHR